MYLYMCNFTNVDYFTLREVPGSASERRVVPCGWYLMGLNLTKQQLNSEVTGSFEDLVSKAQDFCQTCSQHLPVGWFRGCDMPIAVQALLFVLRFKRQNLSSDYC